MINGHCKAFVNFAPKKQKNTFKIMKEKNQHEQTM